MSVGKAVTTPVVAPDGSLYVAVRGTGDVGHVTDGNLVLIKAVSRPGDQGFLFRRHQQGVHQRRPPG